MADAYQAAMDRKAALEAELADIELFLRLHRKFSGEAADAPPTVLASAFIAKSVAAYLSKSVTEVMDTGSGRRTSIILDAVEETLRSEGKPLQRGALVAALEQRGIAIPSADKPRYLGTLLWRQGERFENIEGEGYWLAGVKREQESPRQDSLLSEDRSSETDGELGK